MRIDPHGGIVKMEYEIIAELPLTEGIEPGDNPDPKDFEISEFIHDSGDDTYFRVRRTWSFNRGFYWHTLEEQIDKKEYFKRKLEGTLPKTLISLYDVIT